MSGVYLSRYEEHHWLGYFWAAIRCEDVDRMDLLRKMAAVQVARPATGDVRADSVAARKSVTFHNCFVCRARGRHIIAHHIIQVQHGGSSHLQNQLPLCRRCHADVHPWLVPDTKPRSSWWSARELVRDRFEWLASLFEPAMVRK